MVDGQSVGVIWTIHGVGDAQQGVLGDEKPITADYSDVIPFLPNDFGLEFLRLAKHDPGMLNRLAGRFDDVSG